MKYFEHFSFFEMLWFFGVWIWGFGLICLLTWLWLKRRAMLTGSALWKSMVFTSLAAASCLAVLFGIAVAVIYLPGAGMREGFLFYFMTGVLLPFVFLGGAGFGLAFSVVRNRGQLYWRSILLGLFASSAMIVCSTAFIIAVLNIPDVRSLLQG